MVLSPGAGFRASTWPGKSTGLPAPSGEISGSQGMRSLPFPLDPPGDEVHLGLDPGSCQGPHTAVLRPPGPLWLNSSQMLSLPLPESAKRYLACDSQSLGMCMDSPGPLRVQNPPMNCSPWPRAFKNSHFHIPSPHHVLPIPNQNLYNIPLTLASVHLLQRGKLKPESATCSRWTAWVSTGP